jgi:hypothetical protein
MSEISNMVHTLVGSGFQLQSASNKPSHIVIRAYRTDEFGLSRRYVFAYAGSNVLTDSAITGLQTVARSDAASLVIIGAVKTTQQDLQVLTLDQFVGRLGGSIPSLLALEADYPSQLTELGFNRNPPGLIGNPDDLFEAYVHAGLQFILQDKVIRYGQDRRFEVVPDGVVLGRGAFQLLYDCKAYSDGYPISRNTIRQFADYTRGFHARYENFIGRVHAFLVISSDFKNDSSVDERSKELYAECQVPLVFMTAASLGAIVSLFADSPRYRGAIDWRSIFSKPLVETNDVKKSLRARKKDKVIR